MTVSLDRIAILGATGHVGKCLTSALLANGEHDVVAVARNGARLDAFLATLPHGHDCSTASFEEFARGEYDAVVNCVGVGTPAGVISAGATIFALTEQFDQLVLDHLERRPGTRCVAFSSGAAYCGTFEEPASETTPAVVPLNGIRPSDYYGVAKLASEARHRAAADCAIVDFRLFGLFSRHIDVEADFFMCSVYRAIEQGVTLCVGCENMVRDYIAPSDMATLLLEVLGAEPRNDVIDLYSAAPVAKFDALARLSESHGLVYEVLEASTAGAATGLKPNYYSLNRRAATFGYQPTRTSLQVLTEEMDAMLESRKGGRL